MVTISTFTDEVDAIAQANDTDYGLAASLWTKDIDCAHRMARVVHAGSRQAACTCELVTLDENGDGTLCAIAQGTVVGRR